MFFFSPPVQFSSSVCRITCCKMHSIVYSQCGVFHQTAFMQRHDWTAKLILPKPDFTVWRTTEIRLLLFSILVIVKFWCELCAIHCAVSSIVVTVKHKLKCYCYISIPCNKCNWYPCFSLWDFVQFLLPAFHWS